MIETCGYKRLTSSGSVSDAGKAILIMGHTVLSGGTAAVPYIRNGSGTATDDVAWRGEGTANVERSFFSPVYPVMLPNGCYVSFDANTSAVTVFYKLASNS